MKEPRNPFRLRASEHIESDTTFLRLFSPGMLDLVPAEGLWQSVQILRSAPGGGKTSLMRLFTAPVLRTLHAHRATDDCKEVYQRLRALGVIEESGPTLLGVHLSCARNYASLQDLELDDARKDRLLFSLLSSRIVLAALRGALILRNMAYPSDLKRIEIRLGNADTELQPFLPALPCSGMVIYEWATAIETRVSDALDSLGGIKPDALPGHDRLIALSLIRPGNILLDGQPIAARTLVMLDDVHKLTTKQRARVLENVMDARTSVGIWLAERFEALEVTEMLSSGANQGRDYQSVIPLEGFWRKGGRKFEKLVLNVADRRARASSVETGSFASALQVSLDGAEWQDRMNTAVNAVSARVRELTASRPSFQGWLETREVMEGTPRERAVAWHRLKILIERELRKAQKSFEFVHAVDELEEKDDSAIKAAAELFLAHDAGLPYYFGAARLSTIASSNIEQFLWLAGDEFEEVLSAAVMKQPGPLAPERQEALLKAAVEQRWADIPRRVRNGREVRSFLETVGTFASWVTYQPNAPYAPGVTGIAISMADRDRLCAQKRNSEFERLATVLAGAIAHNLLEPIPDYKVKGDRFLVLNLNRLLCVKFSLPLQYGGFRERTLPELNEWIERGFRPPSKGNTLV